MDGTNTHPATYTHWVWDPLEQKFAREIEEGEIVEEECGACSGSGYKWLEWCQDVTDCGYCGGCGVVAGEE